MSEPFAVPFARRPEHRAPALGVCILVAVLMWFGIPRAVAQVALPLGLVQSATRYNLASTNGMPISSVTNQPPGSNGRAPGPGTGTVGTSNQFQGLLSFANGAGTNVLAGSNGSARVVSLKSVRIGNPVFGRNVSLLFGEVIPPPNKDEYGIDLNKTNTLVSPPRLPAFASDYWLREPFTTTGHTNNQYYWSPHAEQVYATEIGSAEVVWRKATPSAPSGALPIDVATNFINGAWYTLYTNRYVVSPVPFKPPRRMYWTEGRFAQVGKLVTVPPDRVRDLKVVYHKQFPQKTNEVLFGGQSAGPIPVEDTLWFDPTLKVIRAYNVEGRIMVELLGDLRSSTGGRNIHQHLGYEIIDVVQQPTPADVTADLGELVTAYEGPDPEGTPALFPEPILTAGDPFAYRHAIPGTSQYEYFAIRETQNQNDYQVHWMEEGLEGLFWPYRFVRYTMVWPDEVDRYTHYVRPAVDTEADARATAVPLPAENAPSIVYQDPLDGPRGKLTENFAYYSFLDAAHPAHRALIAFVSGPYVRFERIFSWLDQNLRNPKTRVFRTTFDGPAGTGYGSPYVANGVLHLTDAIPTIAGHYVLNDFMAGEPVESFRASFLVRIWDGTIASPAGLADGFAFSFGDLPSTNYPAPPGFFADEGPADGITVNFDLWDNGATDWAPGIVIKTNGVNLAGVAIRNFPGTPNSFPDPQLAPVPTDPATGQPMTLPTDGAFVPASVVLRRDGTMDVSYKGVTVLRNVQTGFQPRAGRFGFSARTGGLYASQWIDDVEISVNDALSSALPTFANSVATNLSAWANAEAGGWSNAFARPRLVTATVNVGDRVTAPDGEVGGGLDTNYLAGFIRASEGDYYHPGAYLDPFEAGFDLANGGAIIPVNAVPGRNLLEVWWFRPNQVDLARGFKRSYWPAVIGRYTIEWPQNGAEIILAGNDGSGPLSSLEAKGSIYYENDRSQPGYNPNEEHALMQGGQAFALRDDLNITTNTDGQYSSHPYVLLEYNAPDGRTAIRTFKVRREKPEAGITFEYNRPAGSILQPPMPLPLLGVPFAPKIAGQPRKGLNEEFIAWNVTDSAVEPGTEYQTLTTDGTHGLKPFWPLALQDPAVNPPTTRWFYAVESADDTLRGIASSNRPIRLSVAAAGLNPPLTPVFWRYGYDTNAGSLPVGSHGLLVIPELELAWPVTINAVSNSPSTYVELDFDGLPESAAIDNANASRAFLVVSAGGANGTYNNWRLAWNQLPQNPTGSDLQQVYASATVTDRKGNVWIYRGPHTADQPESFSMRFYYNTLGSFFFPTLPVNEQPPVGTVTPYLRAIDENGSYVGDAVYGNADGDQQGDHNALPITYHPIWPANAPVLQMAETLTTPRRGLPAVRGQSSVQVLYQQSQISFVSDQLVIVPEQSSVALHDPTREKSIEFDQAQLPGSVKTEISRGKTYFPNLPPHLVKRFFLDPNRGPNGALVFAGEFVDSALGDKYVLLNVAGRKDAATLRGLCLDSDPKKTAWDAAVDGLATELQKFVENPAAPGTYIPSPLPSGTSTASLGDLALVTDDDVAVDSYALTAVGPNAGYVTLIAGNGEAFTPEGEPVSIHVIRVVPDLYRGEVNVIESDNPLNERLTLQQVVDLAGKTDEYAFEWRITAPVDGQPPAIYSKEPALFLTQPWSHVRYVRAADNIGEIESTPARRVAQDVAGSVVPVTSLPFSSVSREDTRFRFTIGADQVSRLSVGDQLTIGAANGGELRVTVHSLPESGIEAVVSVDPEQTITLPTESISRLSERVHADGVAQSIVFSRFVVPPGMNVTELWVGVDLADGMGAKVYVNGGLAATTGLGAGDTPPSNPPDALASPRLERYFRLPASVLAGGVAGPDGSRTNRLAIELFAAAVPGANLAFNVRVEAFRSVDQVTLPSTVWLPLDPAQYEDGVRAIVGGTADVRSLSDNYLTMRYRPIGTPNGWSQWTEPQLAEGWIKRVLKGINPFNQRVTDLFNNAVNTDVSILTQAGQRWEGDIALSLESINNYGLIEIYETVLNRGKMLSIGGGINYGPANDALLLAAGYINDLYMIVGNEASADAANPTIGIGTKDNTYGDIATALFSFKGQLPSLLEEELSLLRGRDDFLVPGVETRPVYNRLVWNYTRGIDAGEVIYALNYNILDQNTDGKVDANDALKLFPQGHGDAYGHYLTALKGYYHLFLDPNFDWVPRSEAVLVLGKPVSVDYQDERKWAAAAGALARTGKQIFDLTWRKDYQSGAGRGWGHFRSTRSSNKRTRFWGADHWAARTGQGAYFNWVVGNAIIPENDPDPAHLDTIQQVDRKTVPELKELPTLATSLQAAMDNAESGLTPLGLPEDTVPFDLNPNAIAGTTGGTHFEQVYGRAKVALNNALVAFDDAKDVTRLMRSEQDSLADFRTAVDKQELAYTNTLIELFGTPYPEDIGPGKPYRTGYAGPDLLHYMYVDNVELNFNGLLDPASDVTWKVDTQTFTSDWINGTNGVSDFSFIQPARNAPIDGNGFIQTYEADSTLWVEYNLSSHGFFKKPATWTGKRSSPGRVQQAISDIIKARNAAFTAFYWADAAKYDLDWAIVSYQWKIESYEAIREVQSDLLVADSVLASAQAAWEITDKILETTKTGASDIITAIQTAVPENFIAGLAAGGDVGAPAKGVLEASRAAAENVISWVQVAGFTVVRALEAATTIAKDIEEFETIAPEEWNQELRDMTSEIRDKVYGMNNHFMTINARLQELDDALRNYRAVLAEADRIQAEREIFRRRTAAIIQGYRSRDAAFRIFRNEKLERYKSLFDLSSQYAFMAAKAYDYETGLLGTARGEEFINRIVNARALGVVQNGEPQFAGSNTGDPGLSSALAEMAGDWSVAKGRLGFNNPDAYGTTVSLRYENFRITTNDNTWQNVLNLARKDNLLDDPDVRRYCLQIDSQNGAPVPGLLLEFTTTIADGLNLFGHPIAAGDHGFNPASFATKIFAAGVALEGYIGMDDPSVNSGATVGAQTPPDPNLVFLNPDALYATPYIYLIPVGVDSMRSPALGDQSEVRTWSINDVAIPLPFNLGGSDFSNTRLWQSEDSLTEAPFAIRKHQSFRPVSSSLVFDPAIYTTTGGLQRTQFTNNRLIGRSVWNSKWKIVIPGRTLLADPNEGLERFIRTVKDVRLHFVTYSYSGN